MRKEKSIKNFLTSIIPFFILTVLGFLRLKVLLNSLGEEIYALNQLFIQLFSYVSLLEAGIGTLITQMYYKHFVKKDKKNINEVYSASITMLKKISILMFVVGVILSFFLSLLTNNSLSLGYMQIVFIIYLFRSVMEYWMFAPRFVLTADQKVYKINICLNIFKIIEVVIEVIILQFYKNYVVILLVSIVLRFIAYFITNKTVFKEYPWLKKVDKKETIKLKGTKDVLAHKLAGTIYSNTDILLASIFLKPISVVIYSSYNYIIKFINDGIYMFGSSILASMGNVMYKDENENQYKIFEKTNSIFIFLAMFFTLALYFSINKFIVLWIGEDKLISNLSLILMLTTLFLSIISRPFLLIRDSKAIYKETKIIAISEAILNLGLSLIFVKYFDITGLLLGTVISSIITTNIFYPKYIYKNVFDKESLKYFGKIVMCIIVMAIICFGGNYLNIIGSANNYLMWFIYSIVYCIFIIIVLFIFNYICFKDFREICNDLKELIKNKLKKR